MTDLTEQWKKGEQPYAEYYIKLAGGEYTNDVWDVGGWQSFNKKGDVVVEVLAPVPSYYEWKQLKEYERIVTSYNMKPIDYDIACETVNKLLDDNKRLKHDVGNLGYKIKNQRHEIDNRLKEVERLKELLKECRNIFKEQNFYRNTPVETDTTYRTRCLRKQELLTKIDEALK